MQSIKDELIKLGHTNPELREHLTPILDHMTDKESRFFQREPLITGQVLDVAASIERSFTILRDASDRGDKTTSRRMIKGLLEDFKQLQLLSEDMEPSDFLVLADTLRKF